MVLFIGEHGNSQVALWSVASAGGKAIADILKDNQNRLDKDMLQETARKARESGNQIMEKKGSTSFGIAAVIAQIVKAILMDENKIFPVSARLAGNYAQLAGNAAGSFDETSGKEARDGGEAQREGEKEIYAGVPAVINREGIQELVEYHLTCDEIRAFVRSVEVLKQVKKKLEEE